MPHLIKIGDGVCRCGNFSMLYRGGFCFDCTKRLTGTPISELMKKDPNYLKERMAVNEKKFLVDRDTVKKIA